MKCHYCDLEETKENPLICCKHCYWNIFHSNVEKMMKLHELKDDTEIKEVKRLVKQIIAHLEGREED